MIIIHKIDDFLFNLFPSITKEFISKAPSPLPTGQAGSPSMGDNALPKAFGTHPSYLKSGKGELISPPLRGGDEGEGMKGRVMYVALLLALLVSHLRYTF